MAQVINTNVMSLNAQRNLNTSQADLAVSVQRLSSGLRINSAKDDAAGLAIATRMSTQIGGLNQAMRNANDGISLAQTAEGALDEVINNLQRIRTLAVQSRNATNSASDRAALDAEVQLRIAELDRVAQQTQFNGLNLLDGTFNSQVFQVGANQGQTITIDSIAAATAQSLGLNGGNLTRFQHTGTAVTGDLSSGDVTLNGVDLGSVTGDAAQIATAINALDSRFGATATNAQTTIAFTDAVGTAAAAATPTDSAASGAFTAADASAGGEVFTFAIDGNTVFTETAADASADVTAAELDTALTTFLGTAAGAGYSLLSGSFATGDAVIRKADGTDMDITLTSNFGTAAGSFAGGIVASHTGGTPAVAGVAPDITLALNGSALDLTAAGTDGTVTGTEVAALINGVSGFTASFSGGNLSIATDDGSNFSLTQGGADAGVVAGSEGLTDNSGGAQTYTFRGSVSINSSVDVAIAGANPSAAGLTAAANGTQTTETFTAINVLTAASSDTVLEVIDNALTTVNSSRANLGAVQNRFESVVANLATTSENLTASRSRIEDADFAAETARLTRAQILQQAGVSMVAQANSIPQSVLALLGG